MVPLTRLDGTTVFLNFSVVSAVEETPSTVIRLRDGETVRVKESAAVVADRVAAARADVVARGIALAFAQEPASLRPLMTSGS